MSSRKRGRRGRLMRIFICVGNHGSKRQFFEAARLHFRCSLRRRRCCQAHSSCRQQVFRTRKFAEVAFQGRRRLAQAVLFAGIHADELCVQPRTRVASSRAAQRTRLATSEAQQDCSTSEKARRPAHGFLGKEWFPAAVLCKLVIILEAPLLDALLVCAESAPRSDFSNR